MTAKNYIQTKLDDLEKPLGIQKPANKDEFVGAIFRTLMSKKFRKTSANEALQEHIKEAIKSDSRRMSQSISPFYTVHINYGDSKKHLR